VEVGGCGNCRWGGGKAKRRGCVEDELGGKSGATGGGGKVVVIGGGGWSWCCRGAAGGRGRGESWEEGGAEIVGGKRVVGRTRRCVGRWEEVGSGCGERGGRGGRVRWVGDEGMGLGRRVGVLVGEESSRALGQQRSGGGGLEGRKRESLIGKKECG